MKNSFLLLCLLLWILPVLGQENSELAVTAPPELLARLKIAPVRYTENGDNLRLPGRVELDEHRVARIGPTVTGRITEIKAWLGQYMHKGQALASIYSTELSNAQSDYLKALTKMRLHKLTVDRGQRLYTADAISHAELLGRESVLEESEVERRARRDQLRVLGMSETAINRLTNTGTIDSVLPIVANMNGVIIERHVSVGQIAQPADDLFTLADLSRLWVVAEVPEQSAYHIHLGQQSEVEIPALPGEHFRGKIIYIADLVNPTTRTVTVRMQVNNPQRRLKPAMLANMLILNKQDTELTVPATAVVRDHDRDHVFVQTSANQFMLRSVALGPDNEGQRKVIGGLDTGEKIVVEGAFHLNTHRVQSAQQ